jgi:hypothetical protein
MAKVTYQFVEEAGRFQTYDGDGNEVVVEAGKPYSTSDLFVQRELDSVPHAVKRVKASGKEE